MLPYIHIFNLIHSTRTIQHNVSGNGEQEGNPQMGEAAGQKHFLLRWTRDDGPAKRRLLSHPVPHHWDLRPFLCFRVSIFQISIINVTVGYDFNILGNLKIRKPLNDLSLFIYLGCSPHLLK